MKLPRVYQYIRQRRASSRLSVFREAGLSAPGNCVKITKFSRYFSNEKCFGFFLLKRHKIMHTRNVLKSMVISEIVVCIYILITCVGVVVNLVFAYKVWSSKVPRNPLLIGMMVSDLSVCAISCPVKTYRCLYQPSFSTLTSVIFLDFFEVCIHYLLVFWNSLIIK